jgi:hypothetical protein
LTILFCGMIKMDFGGESRKSKINCWRERRDAHFTLFFCKVAHVTQQYPKNKVAPPPHQTIAKAKNCETLTN